MSDVQRLEQFFRSRPNVPIPLPEFTEVISPYSLRQRIDDLRKKYGQDAIINTKVWQGSRWHSSYTFKVEA